MRQIEITDLAGFHRVLQAIAATHGSHHSTERVWFRGQARVSWKLLPGLYRETTEVPARYERELTRDFRGKSPPFLAAPSSPEREMFLMQHYGLPTRLLDWTTNPQAALYFAVEAASPESCVVWALSPWRLNELNLKKATVPTAASRAFRHYVLTKYLQTSPTARMPMAVTAVHHDAGIRAQDSVFTVHGTQKLPLEDILPGDDSRPLLARIEIPRHRRGYIKRELYDVGVHRGHLFPDLGGVATEIAYRYSADYFAPDETAPRPVRMQTTETAAATVRVGDNLPRLPVGTPAVPSPTQTSMPSVKPLVDPADAAAQRVAHELVIALKRHRASEIETGKRQGDLHYRMQNDFDRLRRDYEERVGEVIGARARYLDEELVRIIADGDASLLKL